MAQSAGNKRPACRKVGILTSGGDAPGMNAAVRAAAKILITGCSPRDAPPALGK